MQEGRVRPAFSLTTPILLGHLWRECGEDGGSTALIMRWASRASTRVHARR